MITIQHRNRTVDLPEDAARQLASNVYEITVPLDEALARRLRVGDLLAALDEADFLVDGVVARQSFVSAEGADHVRVTVVLP